MVSSYSPRVSNMSEISYFKIFAPGHIQFFDGKFIDYGHNNLKMYVPGKDIGHTYGNINGSNKIVHEMIENLVSSGMVVRVVNPKTLLIQSQSTAIHLYVCLYRNYVPIELINIINTYYGKNGATEFIYPIISKMIGALFSNFPKPYTEYHHWNLPFRNTRRGDFTSMLYWNFGFGAGFRDQPFCGKHADGLMYRYNIDPDLFYHIYKSVNHFDDFVPPERPDDMPPSLPPPNMYNYW
jgi:hypothetical protein